MPLAKPKCSLIPVLGSGGVGKTTTAASIAMALAEQGKKVVVITVDPAHRLAQVLGLDRLSNEPKKVSDTAAGGELWALWLDTQQALEDLVRKHASRLSSVDRVLNNRLFKIIQTQLGGVEEYLGVEKVLGLGESGRFDVCVLDTPPSRHAIDFLESPRHILSFLDESVLRVFLKEDDETQKTGFFKKIFNSGRAQVLDLFKSFLGHTFLGELADLLQNLKPVRNIFMNAAEEIEAWVREPNTYFAMVSTLEPYPLDEARLLQIELSGRDLRAPSLLILNKCLPSSDPDWSEFKGSADSSVDTVTVDYLKAFHASQKRLRVELESFRNPATAVAEINRYSVKQLSREQLLEMGTKVLKTWQSKNPKIFS